MIMSPAASGINPDKYKIGAGPGGGTLRSRTASKDPWYPLHHVPFQLVFLLPRLLILPPSLHRPPPPYATLVLLHHLQHLRPPAQLRPPLQHLLTTAITFTPAIPSTDRRASTQHATELVGRNIKSDLFGNNKPRIMYTISKYSTYKGEDYACTWDGIAARN